MTTATRISGRSAGRWVLPIVLGSLCLAGPAEAAKPGDKGLFDRDAAAQPFVLTIERANLSVEATGVVEASDGALWVTGTIGCQKGEITCGYLAKVAPDGTLEAEYEFAMPGVSVTEFWWPLVTEDGRIAVAATLEPYTPESDGALLIFDGNGTLTDQVLLSEIGLDGGELLHVAAHANGDLALTGSVQVGDEQTEALALRLDNALDVLWHRTERPRERDYSLAGYVSAVLPDDSIVAIGTANDAEYYETYGWIARFDADGNQLWRQWLTGGVLDLMGDTSSIYGNWVDVLPNGNIAFLQSGYNDWGEPTSNVLVQVDAAGTIVTQTPLTFAASSSMFSLAAMSNGDIVVTGDIDAHHPVIARLDADGSVLWVMELDDLVGGYPWGVIEGADGSIIAVGVSQLGEISSAGWVVRLGPDGSEI